MNFFNINFFGPHTKHPILGLQKKVDVPHFLGKDAKGGTHINFFGAILGSKTGPKPAVLGHEEFSLLFFPAFTFTGGICRRAIVHATQ